MDKKQAWIKLVEEKSHHYLNLGDGGFDEMMKVQLVRCNYEEKSATIPLNPRNGRSTRKAASTAAPSPVCSTPPSVWSPT